MPVGEVRADGDVARAQRLDEDLADESLRFPRRELSGEREDEELIDAALGDPSGFGIDGAEQSRFGTGGEHLAGVTVEGDRRRRQAEGVGPGHGAVEDRTVPEMDPVEEPDGHDGSLRGRCQVIEAVDAPHGGRVPAVR